MWPKNKENKRETLLLGDDLGICHMYNFTKDDWHYCEYKLGSGSKGVVNLTMFDHLDEVPLARNRGKVQEEDQGYLRTHI